MDTMIFTNNINNIKLPSIRINVLTFNIFKMIDVNRTSSTPLYQRSIFPNSSIELRKSLCLKGNTCSIPSAPFHHESKSLSYACISHLRRRHSHHTLGLTLPSILQLKHKFETIYHAYLLVLKYPCTFLFDIRNSSTLSPFHQIPLPTLAMIFKKDPLVISH